MAGERSRSPSRDHLPDSGYVAGLPLLDDGAGDLECPRCQTTLRLYDPRPTPVAPEALADIGRSPWETATDFGSCQRQEAEARSQGYWVGRFIGRHAFVRLRPGELERWRARIREFLRGVQHGLWYVLARRAEHPSAWTIARDEAADPAAGRARGSRE